MVVDTVVGNGFRWAVAVLAFLDAAIMGASALLDRKHRTQVMVPVKLSWWDLFAEQVGLAGGTATYFFMGTGALGVIFGWDSKYRLPVLALALVVTGVGRGTQLFQRLRRRRAERAAGEETMT